MARLKQTFKLLWLTGLGLTIFVVGAFYGTITVGVPYPDPTEAQLSSQTRHLAISDWLMLIGLALFLIGLIYIPIHILINRKSQV